MGSSYACVGAVRNLENVGKRMGADLLLNFGVSVKAKFAEDTQDEARRGGLQAAGRIAIIPQLMYGHEP
jgi:hypothetical protein